MRKDVDLRFTLSDEPDRALSVLDLLNGKVLLPRKSQADIEALKHLAASGNAQAQYELAKALTAGTPPAQNNREAVKWLKKSAEKGHAQSEHLLGILIARGQGIRPNPEKAAALFRRAATLGYAPAQYDLARALLWGFGARVDAREALTWFRLAAAQGHVLSQKESAESYKTGRGCQVDLRQATLYLKKAVLGGWIQGCAELANLYMRPDNPAQNESEAVRWTAEAARNGDAASQYRLALFYASGRLVDTSGSLALSWAVRSANGNFIPAYLLCARLMQNQKRPITALALLICAERCAQNAKDLQAQTECTLRRKEIELTLAARQIKQAENIATTTTDLMQIIRTHQDETIETENASL